jgi:aminoglycoside phosphotransferase (APT) family kinase protein
MDGGTESEEQFLRERAAASGITEALAAAAVEQVTGAPPRRVEPFVGGWGAVPFWATAEDGRELVVRVATEERGYQREASVMARVRDAGIPVPEVVGVCRVEGRPVSVLSRIEGVPLQDLTLGRGLDDPEVRAAHLDAGAVLARVHRVDPSGLDLVPPFGEPAEVVVSQAGRLVSELGVDDSWLGALDACMATLAEPVERVLVHRDFGADHVFVVDGRVVGVIDWERAAFDDPAHDLGWWLAYDTAMGGGSGLVAQGYPDPVDAARIVGWAVAECVAGAAFQVMNGRANAATWGLGRARELLERYPAG